MPPWFDPDAAKRVCAAFARSTGSKPVSSVAGASCLITPDAMMTRSPAADLLVWVARIFTYHDLYAIEFKRLKSCAAAIAQKSPCRPKRVIMGKNNSCNHQEKPMRTPKSLYADHRMIYHPELSTCPSCDGPVVGCNYLKWDKIVQTLDQVLAIASRPGHCPNPQCPGHALRLLSAQGQGVAPANSPMAMMWSPGLAGCVSTILPPMSRWKMFQIC